MIISHKHKFIFIKTAKTAGTSMEIALSGLCGPEDIITPILPEDEKLRRELGYPGPQNCLAPITDYGLKDLGKLLVRRRPRLRFYNHISAREIKRHLNPWVWNRYYKFCFERNPWDRVLSFYFWHYKQEPRPSLQEFIASGKPEILRKRGYELYTINGQVVVDRVCFYENLGYEMEQVRRQLELPQELELPRTKSAYRIRRSSYREEYSPEERYKVQEMFSREIALLGYSF